MDDCSKCQVCGTSMVDAGPPIGMYCPKPGFGCVSELYKQIAQNDCQKAFEGWYSECGLYRNLMAKTDTGSYKIMETNYAWQAWQAAWEARGKQ